MTPEGEEGTSSSLFRASVGGIMICYVTCLLSPVQRARKSPYGYLVYNILFTLQNLRNYTREDKIRISRSVPNFVTPISENPINSYDPDSVILASISALGNEKQNLPFSLFTCLFLESSGLVQWWQSYLKNKFDEVGPIGGNEIWRPK